MKAAIRRYDDTPAERLFYSYPAQSCKAHNHIQCPDLQDLAEPFRPANLVPHCAILRIARAILFTCTHES